MTNGTPGKAGVPPPPPKPTSPLMGTVEETYAGSGYSLLWWSPKT